MTGKHAICSPSGATGWMNCPAWASDPSGSAFAREGSAAHELAEQVIKELRPARDFIGNVINIEGQDFVVDEEMADHVQFYANVVLSLPGKLYVEQKLPLTFLTGEPDAEGTSDSVNVFETELFITDLKYGMGVRVEAEENEQLMIYALSALQKFDLKKKIKRVHLMVVQPRLKHVSEWSCDVDTLRVFGEKVTEAAIRKLSGCEDMFPGADTCQWCAKKAICPALHALAMDACADDFEAVPDTPAVRVAYKTDDELDVLFPKMKLISMWLQAVEKKLKLRLAEGADFKTVKLVAGKSPGREWTNEERAADLMAELGVDEEDIYATTLASPAKLEAALAKTNPEIWEQLQVLIEKVPGKPTLANFSDRRPALSGASDFEVTEGGDE